MTLRVEINKVSGFLRPACEPGETVPQPRLFLVSSPSCEILPARGRRAPTSGLDADGLLPSGLRSGHLGLPSSLGSPWKAAFIRCPALCAQLGLGARVWDGISQGEPSRGMNFVLDLKPAQWVGVGRVPAEGCVRCPCAQRGGSSLFTEAHLRLPHAGPTPIRSPPSRGAGAAENSNSHLESISVSAG